MATKRLGVDAKRNNWNDGQQITYADLLDEQNRNVSIDSSNIANFFGSGVLKSELTGKTIFDTEDLNSYQQQLIDAHSFDGSNIVNSSTPSISDIIQGSQLSITLYDVNLNGADKTKVAIFGVSFGDILIHDTLTFNNNGTQVTRGRYKKITGILFNNFAGNLHGSKNLALDDQDIFTARCLIREAESLEVSVDPIMASQTLKPNKYFEDFIPASSSQTATEMLQGAIGLEYSIADLGIGLGSLTQRKLLADDVTTRYGQKFLAKGSNIQKISILLGVEADLSVPEDDAYNWSGSIILAIHPLQVDIDCPVDPVPDNAVDFDPDPTIIAQLSLNQEEMLQRGVVLNNTSQIVEFVFTGTNLSDPLRSPIEANKYYLLAIGRSGNAGTGTILVEEAPHIAENGYMTVYNGDGWINIEESDLWFIIEGDYLKVSNGIAYEDGVGIEVPKIKKDLTNTEVPFVEGHLEFATTSKDAYNYVLLEPKNELSDLQQDQRTGNSMFSRVRPVPLFSTLTQSELNTTLQIKSAPLLMARAKDKNPRGNISNISGSSKFVGSVENEYFHIIEPNADIQTFNLVGSIIYPDTTANYSYRIIEQKLLRDAYGDINGDGIIDESDLEIINGWISDGYSFNLNTAGGQQPIIDGYATLDQVLRADVNGDGIVNSTDISLLSDYLNNAISNFPAGSYFLRTQLKVETLLENNENAEMSEDNSSSFQTAPYNEVDWEIDYIPTWEPDLIEIEDLKRYLPTTFTNDYSTESPSGNNNFFFPNNIIITGDQLNPDGTSYSVDLEISQITLDIPIVDSNGDSTFLDGYKGILLFDAFVAESSDGLTSKGFDALKYHDGSFVQIGDFEDGKVKIVPSILSLANDYPVSGGRIEDIIGMYYDNGTSLLTMYINNTYDDELNNHLPPLSIKISLSIYMKKAGFKNTSYNVTEGEMRELLDI